MFCLGREKKERKKKKKKSGKVKSTKVVTVIKRGNSLLKGKIHSIAKWAMLRGARSSIHFH